MKRLFLLLFFFIFSVHPVGSEEYAVIKTEHLIIRFHPLLKGAANDVAASYKGVKAELENVLQWKSDFIPEILLIRENKTFQQITGNSLFVAFAIPEKNLMVIDYSKMNLHPFSLFITLKHELCHLFLHHHIKKENLPKWLDEGVCQWVSDGFSEIIMDKRSLLNEAIVSDHLIPLRALSDGFPKEKDSLTLAYEESKSITEYMVKEFGKASLLAILNDLKNEVPIAEAIPKNLSVSFDDLEARWCLYLKKKITWFVYFSIHLYEILFFFGALITIYGFIILLIKKREYQDEEEEDEF